MFKKARIVVAPLDWGLGHATRCIPVIHALLEADAEVVIAADGAPMALLRQEFPDLEHARLPGLPIRYGRGSSQLWSMARQFPGMIRSIAAEKAEFERLMVRTRPNAVISDQRFGVRSTRLPSVLITHQLFPFTPVAQGLLRRSNRARIERFDRCWVMDDPEGPGLAGALSHGNGIPLNARYIGIQSRMHGAPASGREHRALDVVVVVSGPEPQRSIFERKALDQLLSIPGEHLLVQGLPGSSSADERGNVRIMSHLTGKELACAMAHARLVVSRSGYTTLMDLAALGRSALIVPTPGQPEQEYLAELHQATGRFMVQRQDELDILAAIGTDLSRSAPSSTAAGKEMLAPALLDLAELIDRSGRPATFGDHA